MNEYLSGQYGNSRKGGMKDNGSSLKETVKLYYGDIDLSDEEGQLADELLESMERNGIKNECLRIIREEEKKKWHWGSFYFSKAACIVFLLCLIVVSTGFIVIQSHIRNIRIKDKENYSLIEIEYNDDMNVPAPAVIEDYKEPVWIPEGYYIDSVYKKELDYEIIYQSEDGYQIVYHQFLPTVNYHFSGENGKSEKVSFGRYSGEFIETGYDNFLVVTDGKYIYILISDIIDRDSLIKMLN